MMAAAPQRRGRRTPGIPPSIDKPAASRKHVLFRTVPARHSKERHDGQVPTTQHQRNKKPKKDDSTAKPLSPGAVTATITTVVPERSKKKK